MRQVRAVIRFVAFVTVSLTLYTLWFVGDFFIPNRQYWRQLAFGLWARAFARIANMSLNIVGQPPTQPYFLVSNHLSYVDIMALRAAVEGVFVAKQEIDGWFLAGRLVRDMGNIYIDRRNRRDIPRAGEKIIETLNRGEGVIVFPEGTSTRGDDVMPFNSSFLEFAARTDLAVSYVSISYRTPEGELPASRLICWWDDITLLRHMLRMFSASGFTATLVFGGEPVANPDRKLLAEELRRKVKEHFVPVI